MNPVQKDVAIGKIYASLTEKGLVFNSIHEKDCNNLINAYEILIHEMNPIIIQPSRLYRGRVINSEDIDCGKGISIIDGVPVGGFDRANSWKPPCDKVEKMGRMNHKYESILYVSEDEETCLSEIKPSKTVYVSVGEFEMKSSIKLLDFSGTPPIEKSGIITEQVRNAVYKNTNCDAIELYNGIQRFFAFYDSSSEYYEVSNKICDYIKKEINVDGVRYKSFSEGNNVAVWNPIDDDYLFVGSHIVLLTPHNTIYDNRFHMYY